MITYLIQTYFVPTRGGHLALMRIQKGWIITVSSRMENNVLKACTISKTLTATTAV
ncbi:hypothetical protein JCM16163A_11160 [Paenibacillus sp. YK5]|nr:hypothetical protein PN4B1_20380 [Paenibacillus naphthalenovorans]